MREKTRVLIALAAMVVFVSGCDLLGALFPGTWETVGSPGFSQPDTDYVRVGVDEVNGIIYTAFQEGTGVSVMRYDEFGDQTWQYVGSPDITGNDASHVSLFVEDDIPYIAFSDGTPGVDGGLSVMVFDGSNWTYLVSAGGISTHGVTYNDLIVENGDVYVAFRENITVSNVRVSKYDGSTWQPYGTDAGVEAGSGGADFIDITRDGGTTYVSFTDNDTNVASVISCSGGDWSYVGVSAISNGDGEYVSLAMDGATPIVSFAEGSGVLSVMSFDGSNWSYVGNAAISQGISSDTSLDVFDGTPIVAYRDWANDYKLSVQQMGRRQWEYVGDPGISAGRADSVSLKAGNAAYYVAYSDNANGNADTVLAFP